MGYWGSAPWDNDYSADWFSGVMEKTEIGTALEDSLNKPVDDFTRDEIRGAVMLFILLGRTFVYDGDMYEEHLNLCIEKNRELMKHWSEGGWDGDPEIAKWLVNELAILERRRNNIGVAPSNRPPIPQELKDWWANWID